jgi:hypothetical protein
VLLDFLAYFQQNHSQPYDVVTSATIDPFTERLNDRLAGNSVTIQIRQPFDWNKCQIPQTGASIPPTVDGLTLYNFCDPSVIARLTDAQITCLEAEFSDPCADASVTVNTTPFGTAPSGGSLDVPVQNTSGTNIGTVGATVVIPNSLVTINGVSVDSVPATTTSALTVLLDGVQSGSETSPNVWSVTSTPCTGNWVRDPNWPAFPTTLTAADERFYGVVAVFENAYNQVGIEITNLAANIDWGDGTSVVSNGATRIKVYDYATLAATVYQWPDGRNVKYVLVDITRVGGALARVVFSNTTTINAQGGNNFVDIYCSFPNADTLLLSLDVAAPKKPMALCQRVRVLSVKAGAGSNFRELVRGMRSLRVLELPYSTLGQWNNLSQSSGQVDDLGDIDWGSNTSMVSAFATTNAKRHGNLTANSATTGIGGYMTDAVRLEEFGNITATSATTLASFFCSTLGSPMLTTVGTINAPFCQNISSMFFRCAAFTGTSFTSCANIVNTNSAFGNCPSIYWMEMFGLTRGVSFAGSAMGNYGMNLFANSIGTATGAQTITVTGTPFGALLTALDATAIAIRLVMTGKGYTVAN